MIEIHSLRASFLYGPIVCIDAFASNSLKELCIQAMTQTATNLVLNAIYMGQFSEC